jgi:hypothetical protein
MLCDRVLFALVGWLMLFARGGACEGVRLQEEEKSEHNHHHRR